MNTQLDRKGIFSFLAITFGITVAIEGGLILAGFRLTGRDRRMSGPWALADAARQMMTGRQRGS